MLRLTSSDDSAYDDSVRFSWLGKAIQCGVENIEVSCGGSIDVPSNIFNCTTLVVLKLNWADFEIDGGFPSVYLPSLKTLHLNPAYFKNDQDILEFLYGCPILENFLMIIVFIGPFGHSSSEDKVKFLPKLVRAEVSSTRIYRGCNFEVSLTLFSNVEFLRLNEVCMSQMSYLFVSDQYIYLLIISF